VLVTGPFASAARRGWAAGAALVGDAADFFDPFTGEGIYAALRGAELLAPRIVEALGAPTPRDADVALRRYDRDRVREFSGKWAVERIIGAAVSFPALMNVAARSLELRPEMAHMMVGVTGDFVPAREVLRPAYLARLLLPWSATRRVAGTLTTPESS
jgi:flavin-dependent dehydrogenase